MEVLQSDECSGGPIFVHLIVVHLIVVHLIVVHLIVVHLAQKISERIACRVILG